MLLLAGDIRARDRLRYQASHVARSLARSPSASLSPPPIPSSPPTHPSHRTVPSHPIPSPVQLAQAPSDDVSSVPRRRPTARALCMRMCAVVRYVLCDRMSLARSLSELALSHLSLPIKPRSISPHLKARAARPSTERGRTYRINAGGRRARSVRACAVSPAREHDDWLLLPRSLAP